MDNFDQTTLYTSITSGELQKMVADKLKEFNKILKDDGEISLYQLKETDKEEVTKWPK